MRLCNVSLSIGILYAFLACKNDHVNLENERVKSVFSSLEKQNIKAFNCACFSEEPFLENHDQNRV